MANDRTVVISLPGGGEVRIGHETDLEGFSAWAFWGNLPKKGPNGGAVFPKVRINPDGNTYISMVCPSERVEMFMGQYKVPAGALFIKPKWEPFYKKDGEQPTKSPAPDDYKPAGKARKPTENQKAKKTADEWEDTDDF